jgi:hypothetical protein
VKIDDGGPIVAELRRGEVLWVRLHLAVASKTRRVSHGGSYERSLAEYRFPPLEWGSLCGLSGFLYSYGRWIRDREIPFCSVCLERCNAELGGRAHGWEEQAPAREWRAGLEWNRSRERPRHVAALAHSRARHEALLATLLA